VVGYKKCPVSGRNYIEAMLSPIVLLCAWRCPKVYKAQNFHKT